MTNANMEKKIVELKELEVFLKEIEKEIDTIKDQLKAEMTRRKTDEISVGIFTMRYKPITSKRFDSKAFKASHEDLYSAYVREGAIL